MAVISPINTQTSVPSAPVQQRVVVQQAPAQGAPNAAQGASNAAQEKPVTEKSVQQAVNQANQMLTTSGSSETISFAYEEKLNQLFVKIVDQNTGAVVREIPSKDFIRNQIALREMIGLILDKKA